MTEERLHGTAVSVGGLGVLMLGPSGSGKSDLALRLIDRGASLVADDQVIARRVGDAVELRCPERTAGLLEVRGLGIVRVEAAGAATLALVLDLGGGVERMPLPLTRTVAGVSVRALLLDPRPASAAVKVEWALRARWEEQR